MSRKLLQFKLFSLFFIDTTIIFFSALSADLQFEACEPTNCGNVTKISYPFWISSQGSFCGLPEFKLTCLTDEPLLRMSDTYYSVRYISFETQSLLVAKSFEGVCPLVQNLTFNNTPFRPSRANFNFSFFFNCTNPTPQNLSTFSIPCLSNESHYSFAMFGYGALSRYLNFTRTCVSSAVVPVVEDSDVTANPTSGSYTEFLRKGFVLEWAANATAINCIQCEGSGGRCGTSINGTIPSFVCFCSDQPYAHTCNDSRKPNVKRKVIVGVCAGIGSFLTACLLAFLFYRPRHNRLTTLRSLSADSSLGPDLEIDVKPCEHLQTLPNVEAFLNEYGSFAPKRYKYSAVKKMTKSFRHKLGQGGYGDVFKGKLPDSRSVAVKILTKSKGNGEDFINEVASIGRTSHVNIVTLLGFCSEGPKRALIYEFMPNGSLEKFIYSDRPRTTHPLGWEKLYQITIGIARGLEYLHCWCNTRILHFDIKPHNILLDKDFCPKISDFGLAKLCPSRESSVSMLDARGTVGYTAPELFCRNIGSVSNKSDVYSYGMMVLEMVGGRKNIDPRVENISEIYFPHWIYNRLDLHENLELCGVTTGSEEEIARKMIVVALWCIQTDPMTRPSMTRVVEMLEGSLEGLLMPPKPYLSSPSRS